MYLAGFAAVLIAVGVVLAIYRHFQQPSPSVAVVTAPSTAAGTSALDSIPAPTGGGNSSDVQSPNVPMTDSQKVEDEDAKTQAEQNWKADHVGVADTNNSNVTAEDQKELDDSEKPVDQPVNRPK